MRQRSPIRDLVPTGSLRKGSSPRRSRRRLPDSPTSNDGCFFWDKFTNSRSRRSRESKACRSAPSSPDCTERAPSSSRCSARRCEMPKEVAMLRLDELEKLSRFAAGDLSPKEAEHVKAGLEHRPELADALAQLSRLDL